MSDSAAELAEILPHAAPTEGSRRTLLFAMRRVAAAGLGDAHAANAFLTLFGRGYRRPLLLLRALMAEASRVSQKRIAVAPCCCTRMTDAEAVLLSAAIDARREPHAVHRRLCDTLGVHNALGALSSAQALGQAFQDAGRPLE